jgi:hypothetical protein
LWALSLHPAVAKFLDFRACTATPIPVKLSPDLVGAVDAELLGMDPGDLCLELAVAHGSG